MSMLDCQVLISYINEKLSCVVPTEYETPQGRTAVI